MNRYFVSVMILTLGLSFASLQAEAQDEEVKSLRGEVALDAEPVKPPINLWQQDRDPIPRDYVQQPPLIPHDITGYKINLKFNKCLSCHSWTAYKEAGATKISQTHFADRTEHVLADVAARRYFCTQCHVSQTDARPLVHNDFQPLTTIKEE